MKKPGFSLVFIFVILLGCMSKNATDATATVLASHTQEQTRYQYLDTLVPQLLETYEVPSISLSIIEDAKIVWSGVFGQQSPNKAVDNNTLYLCASITKPLTGEVFMRLATQGKVSLDEPMYNSYVDTDIKDDPRAKLLTPRHVLTHQTGFKNWRRMTDGELRFVNDPGTKMGYSGEGFQYLVRFVEKKMGRPFNDIAKEVLFEPLKMENSALAEQDWYQDRLAWPKFPDGNWVEPRARKEVLGAGGLHTTSEDYARFLIGILKNEGVSEALRRQQFTISLNQRQRCLKSAANPEACPADLGFGLSWYIYDFEDERIIGHTGANLGERTLAVFSPEKKSGFVAMTNGANGNYVIFDVAKRIGVNTNFIAIEKPKKDFQSSTE